MKTRIERITPQRATELLENNTHNRPLNNRHVQTLANEMTHGRWKLNGATISTNGNRLLDGQHRLQACILSGVPFETLLVEGLDDDVFDTIDAGEKRRAGDVLAIRGEKHSRTIAAALLVVDSYITGTVQHRKVYTSTMVEELLAQHGDIRASAVDFNVKKSHRLLPMSLLVACHYLFSMKDKELAELFFSALINGEGLRAGEPVYFLRERLIQNTLSHAKLKKPHLFALTVKAWNHTRRGDSIKQLRWRIAGPQPEAFPIIE